MGVSLALTETRSERLRGASPERKGSEGCRRFAGPGRMPVTGSSNSSNRGCTRERQCLATGLGCRLRLRTQVRIILGASSNRQTWIPFFDHRPSSISIWLLLSRGLDRLSQC